MARGTTDFSREQIIKDGYLKHREPGIVTRWRHRFLVFKVTNAGRLTLTVFKDQPPIPDNELTNIPIEEFGGLDCNMKIDGEKQVLAILTTHVTECFATDSSETLREWRTAIQDYLGKELVLNIDIPYKQKMLKPGKAQMRIRNTGFTITTADTPPKCQGSWQILHIRKFGGSDSFRFETGSKCPSGEFLYVINTEDTQRMKRVFTDLSLHKPIFQDDRTGRRMTQEHHMLQRLRDQMISKSHEQLGPRHSLQNTDRHTYAQASQRRISVQHETLMSDSRPRSHAVLVDSQTLPNFKNSPYYNVSDVGLIRKHSNNPRASSTSPSHENIYYNKDAIALQKNLKKNSKTFSDSSNSLRGSDFGDDSDDDFVDVHGLTGIEDEPGRSIYYNLRDTLVNQRANLRERVKRKSQIEQPNYENLMPTHSRYSSRSSHGQIGLDEHPYTNLNVLTTSDEDHTPVNDELTSSATSTIINTNQTDGSITVTLEEETKPIVSIDSTHNEKDDVGSHSDPECFEGSTLRRRTTSIVEHLMISADHNSRSCEDLRKIDLPMWKEVQDASEIVHSDSELFGDNTSQRKKSKLVKHKIINEDDWEDNSTTPSPVHNKTRSRTSDYDHLELKRDSEISTSSLAGISPKPSQQLVDPQKQVTTLIEGKLSLSTNDEETKTGITSTKAYKRRQHTYEDIDLPDDDRTSSSSSPESPSSTPKHSSSYDRKVGLLGHGHTYEFVDPNESPLLDTSSQVKLSNCISSPKRLGTNSRKKLGSTSISRSPLPLQNVSLDGSFETDDLPALVDTNKPVKRPIPTPRNVMMKHSSFDSPTRQHSKALIKSHTVHDDIIIPNDKLPPPRALRYTTPVNRPRNDPTYVNGNVIHEEEIKPALPPKPNKRLSEEVPFKSSLLRKDESREWYSSSEIVGMKPAIPPKQLKHNHSFQEHYAQIYVSTQPVQYKGRERIERTSGKGRMGEKDSQINYTEINHFMTEQLQHMIEQRRIEKGLSS